MRVVPTHWALFLLTFSIIPQSQSLAASTRSDGISVNPNHYLAPRDETALRETSRFDVGTKDAPVDGKDGKPHAGPFVDPLPEKDHKTHVEVSLRKQDLDKALPEDSVMNDPSRKAPKKGTTGTEGGVTEKERTRKAQESETGELHKKKPEPPKEPLPAHTEEANKIGNSAKARTTTERSKDDDAAGENNVDKKGPAGLRKPDNLPDTPHQIPHPEPPSGNSRDHSISSKSSLDSDSDDEATHGSSELIPWDALMGSFSSIAASEIGDKTFIVAALMAMRHPRLQVFTAAFSALLIMTVLSAVTGHAVGSLISKSWASVLAALLFLVFGLKSLKEGFDMDPDQGVGEEMREVQAELEEKEVDMARTERGRQTSVSAYALESGRVRSGSEDKKSSSPLWAPKTQQGSMLVRIFAGIKNLLGLVLSPAWVETFSMTFIGELGDRSQIATVAMAAGQEYLWVMVGATLGHFLCTAVAVLGGSVLAGRITMRKVTLAGGAIFIVFGLFALYEAMTLFY